MRKPIAIAFSDIHIEDWQSHSKDHSRFKLTIQFLSGILKKAEDKGIPILFCGDLFENNKVLSNYVLNHIVLPFIRYKPIIFGIAGNHDQSEINNNENDSPNYFRILDYLFGNITELNKNGVYLNGSHNLYIHGIPYITGNKDYRLLVKKANKEARRHRDRYSCKTILLIHSDLAGAVNTSGFQYDAVPGIPTNTKKFFKGFDLVFNGHVHKPQKIGKVQILGAVYHQKVNDMNTDMGYWVVYDDLSMKFYKSNFPEFKELAEDETAPDNFNFWIKKRKKITLTKNKYSFDKNIDRSQLAKNYLKALNIKDAHKLKLLVKYLNDTL